MLCKSITPPPGSCLDRGGNLETTLKQQMIKVVTKYKVGGQFGGKFGEMLLQRQRPKGPLRSNPNCVKFGGYGKIGIGFPSPWCPLCPILLYFPSLPI